jgi:hypothetical protein
LLRLRDAGDMVQMGVCEQDVANRQPVLLDGGEQQIDLVAGIDDDPLVRLFAAQNEAVLEEGSGGVDFDNHWL